MHRIFTTSVASVYPLYVAKLERKGRTALELDEVICWLTGYTPTQLHLHLNEQTTFDEFFSAAISLPSARCGICYHLSCDV
ncbi:MAG: DUF2200 family protein [Actinomycetales bacterium]